jgi:osmotically-inducible protein OsmY
MTNHNKSQFTPYSTLLVTAACLLGFTLQGCFPAALVGTGTAAKVVADERSVGEVLDDATIGTRISNSYFQKDTNNLFHKVGVKVHEGRVLLTGSVPTASERMEAVRLAWAQRGVKEVINEINISNQKQEGVDAVKRVSKDSWVTTQIKTKLFFEKDIHSVNYSIETIHGTVYVMGIAQNKPELDKALDIIRTIPGVQKVISHVRLRNAAYQEQKHDHHHHHTAEVVREE